MLGDPCMQDECVHWKSARVCPDPREPEVVEILWDCVHNLNYIANRDAARFGDQTGAAVTTLTSEIKRTAEERIHQIAGSTAKVLTHG